MLDRSEKVAVAVFLAIVFVLLTVTLIVWSNEKKGGNAADKAGDIVPPTSATTIPTTVTTALGCDARANGEVGADALSRADANIMPTIRTWIAECGSTDSQKSAALQQWMHDHDPNLIRTE